MPFPLALLATLGGSALLGGLSSRTANKGKWSQQNRFNPQQQNLFAQAGQLGLNQIQNPYQGFEPIAQRARSQFFQDTIPGIAERFTGSTNAALSSPALYSQLGSAGAGLQEGLAALQSQYGQRQQALGQNLLGMGLTPQSENVYTAGGPSFLSGLLGGASQGLGSLGNLYMLQKFLGSMPNNPYNGGAGQDVASLRSDPLNSLFS